MFYLYVKTHNVTGLKYLGYTSQDPHSYHGSGIYWRAHLEKHGYNYTTEILCECQDKSEIREQGLYYTTLWNIVESNDWANLKEECGDGGRQSAEIRQRIGEAGRGRVPWNKGKKIWTEEQRREIGRRNIERGPQSVETIAKRVAKNTGKKRSKEAIKNLTEARRQRAQTEVVSEEARKKMSEAALRRGFNGYGFDKGHVPHNAQHITILEVNTGDTFEVTGLKTWCRENNISYGGMWKAFKEGRDFKGYRKVDA